MVAEELPANVVLQVVYSQRVRRRIRLLLAPIAVERIDVARLRVERAARRGHLAGQRERGEGEHGLVPLGLLVHAAAAHEARGLLVHLVREPSRVYHPAAGVLDSTLSAVIERTSPS